MNLPLKGIKVVETASTIAGPMAGRLLADWGADVIHIEHPIRGETQRNRRADQAGGRVIMSDIDYRAENHHRNKRGMAIDVSQERGREILCKLLEKADVFLSNFRPRELKKFKLEHETLSQLNPRLISAVLTGHGRKGPDKDLPAYESTSYFARTGMLHVLQVPGVPPANTPIGLGDYVTGLSLAYGIMTALFARERTGVGQEVDVSLFQTGTFAISTDIAGALVTGQDRQPGERKDIANALMNFYPTKDGRWLRLAVGQPDLYWSRVCSVIGREDLEHDPKFSSHEPRVENHVALFHILEEAFSSKTLDEWKAPLTEAALPWAPLQSLPEVIADPQARADDYFISYDHPAHGRIELVANPVKLNRTSAPVRMPAPEFDQHTVEILLENGYTREDIEQFKQQHIVA